MGQRHDAQQAPRANDGIGLGDAFVDHRREATAVVDDLHEAERATDVDDAAEGIIAVRLPQDDVEARRSQSVGDLT